MPIESSQTQDTITASSIMRPSSADGAKGGGVFTVTCTDADGKLKWEDTFHNLVVDEGLQYMNQSFFAGVGYTGAWYLGLVAGPGSGNTYAAGNTLAIHAGWTELVPGTAYTGNRKTVTFGTATTADPSVISNSASPSTFAMLVNGTVVAGALLSSVATGTSGTLFSVGNFTGGDKTVDSGDTLSVTYSFSLDAA